MPLPFVFMAQSLIKQRDNLTDTIFLSKINLNCTGRELTGSVLLVTAGVQRMILRVDRFWPIY